MNKSKRRLLISILLIIIWMLCIFFMSDMNTNVSNGKSKSIVNEIVERIDKSSNTTDEVRQMHQSNKYIERANYVFRKIMHAIVYFALSILVFNLLIRIKKTKLLIYNLLTIIICFLYAITDEFHQIFVTGRNGQILDVLIDTGGAILGSIVISIIYLFVKKRLKEKNYE